MAAEWRNPGVTLPTVVPPEPWQRLQDHFADVLGIGLRTYHADRHLLTTPSWPSGLDAQRLAAVFKLGEELDELLPSGKPPTDTLTVLRPLGVSFSVCPLTLSNGAVAAYLVVGPVVLGRRETAEQVAERAQAAGLDPHIVWPLILTVKLYSFGGMRSVLRLLQEVGSSVLDSAHRARQLKAAESAPGAPSDIDRLSRSLLDTATAATGAEGGSVMLYDGPRQWLRIRASEGLAEPIVRQTALPPGAGLTGIAIAERRMLLLDAHTTDARLRRLMTRTELTSSLVAPLIPHGASEPIGALTLWTASSQRRFGAQDVQMLQRLLGLAGLALARTPADAGGQAGS
jgi:hypothetical protein